MLASRRKMAFRKPAFSRKAATTTVRTERRSDAVIASRGRRNSIALASLLETEEKYFDTSASGTSSVATDASGAEIDPAGSGGALLCLNAMAQGDTQSTREGNKVVNTGISIRGNIGIAATQDQADPPKAGYTRLYLVQDKQTNGAQLNSEDVFVNPAASATTSADVFRNRDRSSRYRVLATVTVADPPLNPVTDGTNTSATGGINVPFEMYWKGKIPTKFSGSTNPSGAQGVIADVVDNSFHVLAYSAQVSRPIRYNARLTFVG